MVAEEGFRFLGGKERHCQLAKEPEVIDELQSPARGIFTTAGLMTPLPHRHAVEPLEGS